MAAFAASEDLRLFLRLPAIDATAADALLEMVAEVIRADVGQQLDAVTDDTVALAGNGDETLLLPQLPVTKVTAVTVSGTALVDGTDYTWAPSGVLTRLGGSAWPTTPRSVTVTYTHGYATPPGVLKTVSVQAAARAWINPGQLGSETIADWARTWRTTGVAPAGRIELSEFEQHLLDQLRP